MADKKITIALAGNPNSGKTTLFNTLTGSNQFVGNWPGVTVEKKEGRLKKHDDVMIEDLPGIYSLSPYTMEEVVSRNFLIDEKHRRHEPGKKPVSDDPAFRTRYSDGRGRQHAGPCRKER